MWNISQSSRYTSFFNLLHCTLNCLVSTKDHTLMCKHIYNICGYLVRSAKNRLPKWCPWINLHLLLFLPPILSISFFPEIVLKFMILYLDIYICICRDNIYNLDIYFLDLSTSRMLIWDERFEGIKIQHHYLHYFTLILCKICKSTKT